MTPVPTKASNINPKQNQTQRCQEELNQISQTSASPAQFGKKMFKQLFLSLFKWLTLSHLPYGRGEVNSKQENSMPVETLSMMRGNQGDLKWNLSSYNKYTNGLVSFDPWHRFGIGLGSAHSDLNCSLCLDIQAAGQPEFGLQAHNLRRDPRLDSNLSRHQEIRHDRSEKRRDCND